MSKMEDIIKNCIKVGREKACEKCSEIVSKGNYSRHYKICGKKIYGKKKIKGGICKFCLQEFVRISEHEKKCTGRKKAKRTKKICEKCLEMIESNGYEKHERSCSKERKIRRRRMKYVGEMVG